MNGELDLINIVERLGLVGALMIAVGVLWFAWAAERLKLDQARKAFDERLQELQDKHLEDLRLLAGMDARAWQVQGSAALYRTTNEVPRVTNGGD